MTKSTIQAIPLALAILLPAHASASCEFEGAASARPYRDEEDCWSPSVAVVINQCLPLPLKAPVPTEVQALASRSVLLGAISPSSPDLALPGASKPTPGPSPALCEDEPFAGEPELGHCSGVLLGEGLVLTAAHCLHPHGIATKISNLRVYTWNSQFDECKPGVAPATARCRGEGYSVELVRTGDGIDPASQLGEGDYAILRIIDPPPALGTALGRLPVWRSNDGDIGGHRITAVGFPKGVRPLATAPDLAVNPGQSHVMWGVQVSAIGGVSGAPVWVERAGEQPEWRLLGIMVGGAEDYVVDPDDNCSCHATATGGTSEGVMLAEYLLPGW